MSLPAETESEPASSQTGLMPDETLTQFRSLAEPHLDTCLSLWCDCHRDLLTTFRDRLQTCLGELTQASSETGLYGVWRSADVYIRDLQTWVDTQMYIAGTTTPDEMTSNWSEVAAAWIQTLPEQSKISVFPEDWKRLPDDTFRVRQWKRVKRTGYFFSRKHRDRSRSFSMQALTRYYLTLPYRAFLVEERARHLDMVVRHLSALSHIPHDLGLECLFLDHAEEVWVQAARDRIASRGDVWAAYPEEIDAVILQIDDYREAAKDRFARWFEATAAQYHNRWRFAGTYILPASVFSDTALAKQTQQDARRFEETRDEWMDLVEAEQDDWRHEMALKRIQLQAGIAYFEVRARARDVLTEHVAPAFSSSIQPITDALQTIHAIDATDTAALERAIEKEKRALVRLLRRRILPQVTDVLLQADVIQIIEALNERLETPIQTLSPTHRIVRRRDMDKSPPVLDVEEAPIKALIADRYLSDIQISLEKIRAELQQDINTIAQRLSEIDQVVEFNLDAALNLIREQQKTTDAWEAVSEGLARAQKQVEQSIQQCDGIRRLIEQHAYELTHAYLSNVQTLLDSDEVLKLKIQWAQAQARERYRHYRQLIWTAIRRAIPWLLSSAAVLGRRLYAQYRKMHRMAGLEAAPAKDLQQFLTETQQRLEELPYVYRRVFHPDTGTDRRFLAGRDEELAELETDFQHWQQGHYMTTVIVGERGSGRTTLLEYAERDIYQPLTVQRLSIEYTIHKPPDFLPYLHQAFPTLPFDSLDAFEPALLKLETPCVCIIENIQNLFIKTIEGFNLLEQFLLIMTRTYRHVYWVVSCTLYSWIYLQKTIRIEQYFQRSLMIDRLSQAEMESVIMKRHRVTGYQAMYEIPDSVRRSRRFKKIRDPEAQQAYLKDMCFAHLQEIALGNISVGMLFWLRSITVVKDNTLYINPLTDFDESSIALLSPDEMFTLGAILQHATLSADDHALIFSQEPVRSLTMLELLRNKRILIETDGTYRIHPLLYRPIVQALKRMNILH